MAEKVWPGTVDGKGSTTIVFGLAGVRTIDIKLGESWLSAIITIRELPKEQLFYVFARSRETLDRFPSQGSRCVTGFQINRYLAKNSGKQMGIVEASEKDIDINLFGKLRVKDAVSIVPVNSVNKNLLLPSYFGDIVSWDKAFSSFSFNVK